MKILFLNNSGGGFADYVDTAEGSNVEAFLTQHVHGYKTGNLLIRVNRQPVTKDYLLQDGDRVSATPLKVEGASHARLIQLVKKGYGFTRHRAA